MGSSLLPCWSVDGRGGRTWGHGKSEGDVLLLRLSAFLEMMVTRGDGKKLEGSEEMVQVLTGIS